VAGPDAWPAGSSDRLADFVADLAGGALLPDVRAWIVSGAPEIQLYETPPDEDPAGALAFLTAIRAA
jgi:hypothetical protein